MTADISSREQVDKLHAYMDAVCRIVVKNEQEMEDCGTGFLIGPNLLMTCNHVIPDLETAKKAEAQFFKRSSVTERPTGGERNVHPHDYVNFDLNPAMFFHSPHKTKVENRKTYFLPADQDHLDYTILPLQPDPSLEGRVHFSLFEAYALKPEDKRKSSILYEHPYASSVDVSSRIEFKGALGRGTGSIVNVDRYECHYTTPTAFGSSGGPVVDKAGNLIALHYQGGIKDDCFDKPPNHTCNAGVMIAKILENLKEHKETISSYISSTSPETPSTASTTGSGARSKVDDSAELFVIAQREGKASAADSHYRQDALGIVAAQDRGFSTAQRVQADTEAVIEARAGKQGQANANDAQVGKKSQLTVVANDKEAAESALSAAEQAKKRLLEKRKMK